MMAPFIMNSRLKKLMQKRMPDVNKFIVVSAMEGKFYRYKTPNHPTNMAKAAINMMTRTSSEDYSKSNIFMNSIDTDGSMMKTEKARKIFEEIIFKHRSMKSMLQQEYWILL